jgi:apolipoprotein N-acyltransferase
MSIATDAYGRVLASLDHFAVDRRVMVVEVPTERVPTIYSAVGDLFSWITILGFLAIVSVTVVTGRIRQVAN